MASCILTTKGIVDAIKTERNEKIDEDLFSNIKLYLENRKYKDMA